MSRKEITSKALFCKQGVSADQIKGKELKAVLATINKLAENEFKCLKNVGKFIDKSKLGEKTDLSAKQIGMAIAEQIRDEALKRTEKSKGIISKDYLTTPAFKVVREINRYLLGQLREVLANDLSKGAFETKLQVFGVFNRIVDNIADNFDTSWGSNLGNLLIKEAKIAA